MKMNNSQLLEKAAALAKHLGISADEVREQICDTYGMTTFNADGGEYAIATDAEANEAAAFYVADSLWAFNASFIMSFCGLRGERLEKVFQKMQSELCEDSNEIVRAMIGERMENFVSNALQSDGRGHFLSGYDGEENEADGFYIYRTN